MSSRAVTLSADVSQRFTDIEGLLTDVTETAELTKAVAQRLLAFLSSGGGQLSLEDLKVLKGIIINIPETYRLDVKYFELRRAIEIAARGY